MKNSLFKKRWMQIVFGGLLMVAGILIVVFSIIEQKKVTNVISVIMAVLCFMIGLVYLLTSFITETKALITTSLIFGSMFVAVGVLLSMKMEIFGQVIVYFVGAILCAIGNTALVKGIIFLASKEHKAAIIFSFIMAALGITLGILVFVYQDKAAQAIYIGAGVIIAILGIIEIVLGIRNTAREHKKDDNIIEAQIEQKD